MSSTQFESIADKTPRENLEEDITRLRQQPDCRILERSALEVFFVEKNEAPFLFRELCRQREITFRHAGQGTGNALDMTPEDDWYQQLILWDSSKGRIAGAYRIGNTAQVLPEKGMEGLYLGHMFTFDSAFLDRGTCALELTRSFVPVEYQNDRLALPLLWQGLGLTSQRLGVDRMFGSVTLSADFSEHSQKKMVGWLKRYRSHQPKSLAQALCPFPDDSESGWDGFRNIDALKEEIVDAAGGLKPIPPLLRHYLKLGASFHAFHIEASFKNAIYCLLEVEIAKMPKSYQLRFKAEKEI